MQTKTKNLKRKLIISIVSIFTLLIIGFVFREQILTQYYMYTLNNFKRGNKVFLSASVMDRNKKTPTGFAFLKLVRPISEQDINEMDIDQVDKATMINKLDPSLKPYMVFTDIYVDIDTLFKTRSAYVGRYLYSKFSNFKHPQTGKFFTTSVYAIEPDYVGYDNSLISREYSTTLPEGYTWADKIIYVNIFDVSDKEYPDFTK